MYTQDGAFLTMSYRFVVEGGGPSVGCKVFTTLNECFSFFVGLSLRSKWNILNDFCCVFVKLDRTD